MQLWAVRAHTVCPMSYGCQNGKQTDDLVSRRSGPLAICQVVSWARGPDLSLGLCRSRRQNLETRKIIENLFLASLAVARQDDIRLYIHPRNIKVSESPCDSGEEQNAEPALHALGTKESRNS
jgi:hypothetical protein